MKNKLRIFISATAFSLALTLPVFASTPATPYSQYIEAESGSISSPMVKESDSSASGGSYVVSHTIDTSNTGTGGSVSLTVNVPVMGTYVLWGNVLSVNGDTDSFYVSVDGGAEDIWDTAEKIWSPNWHWTRVTARGDNGGPNINNTNPHLFNLNVGNHTFKFRGRESNAKLDRIFITNDTSGTPGDKVSASPTLAVSRNGSGSGTVYATNGIACGTTCSVSRDLNSSIILTAVPDPNSTFTGWSGACSGTTGSCTVTLDMVKNYTVTATFTKVSASPTLTILKNGTGSGTVSGKGITCGTACSVSADSNSSFILTALPDSNSTFTGWLDICSGTTGSSCTINNITSNTTVTATFTSVGLPPPPPSTCTNPPSVPGTASPCPVLSLSQTTISKSSPLTITLTPGGEKYLYKTIYVSKGTSSCSGTDWCSFDLGSPYVYTDWKQTSSPVSITIPANTLSVGTHYILGLDLTYNGGSCYIGPGSTSCGGGMWRLQRVDVTN